MFHVKHCKFSAGAVGVPVICDKHSFFTEEKLIIIVSHETIAVLMIIDASWLLQ